MTEAFKWPKRAGLIEEMPSLYRYSNECLCWMERMVMVIRITISMEPYLFHFIMSSWGSLNFRSPLKCTECLWIRNKSYFDFHLLKRCQRVIYSSTMSVISYFIFALTRSCPHRFNIIFYRADFRLRVSEYSLDKSVWFLFRLLLVISITLNYASLLLLFLFTHNKGSSNPAVPFSLL